MERTEDFGITELLAAGRDLEEIANAKREVESMRLVHGVREALMCKLEEIENRIAHDMHLGDCERKGGSGKC